MRLFFYDHPGANGKAFAGVDVLRAHGAHMTGGSAEATFTLFGRGRSGLEREELESKRSCGWWRSRPHMQIVCIPTRHKTTRDKAADVVPLH